MQSTEHLCYLSSNLCICRLLYCKRCRSKSSRERRSRSHQRFRILFPISKSIIFTIVDIYKGCSNPFNSTLFTASCQTAMWVHIHRRILCSLLFNKKKKTHHTDPKHVCPCLCSVFTLYSTHIIRLIVGCRWDVLNRYLSKILLVASLSISHSAHVCNRTRFLTLPIQHSSKVLDVA